MGDVAQGQVGLTTPQQGAGARRIRARESRAMKKTSRQITSMDCVECYAVPGESSMIDSIHPVSGRTWYGGYATLEEVRATSPDYAGAVRMTIEEFLDAKVDKQRTPISWHVTTREVFDRMLECLPPELWLDGGFLVGEPADHCAATGKPRFDGFRKRGEVYESTNRPVTEAEFRECIKL